MPSSDACGARTGDHRAEADADYIEVNTEMLQLRLMEKRRELVRRGEVDALIDRHRWHRFLGRAFLRGARRSDRKQPRSL